MPTLEQARSWYPNYDAVHGFGHIKRVYRNCEKIGPLEGADMEILLAAALLHDARGSHPGEGNRNEHHLRSADFAKIILLDEHWADIKIKRFSTASLHTATVKKTRHKQLRQKFFLMLTNWMLLAQ